MSSSSVRHQRGKFRVNLANEVSKYFPSCIRKLFYNSATLILFPSVANFLSINQNVQLRRKKKKLESWKQWKAESKKSLTDKMKTFEEFGRKTVYKRRCYRSCIVCRHSCFRPCRFDLKLRAPPFCFELQHQVRFERCMIFHLDTLRCVSFCFVGSHHNPPSLTCLAQTLSTCVSEITYIVKQVS